MQDAFDLTELKAHLTQLAQAQGFLVDVQLSDEIELPGSKGDPHIKVSVHNTSKSPPVTSHFYVSVRQFERGGVHVFDAHMADACANLSAY
jgi:hypothetical protein